MTTSSLSHLQSLYTHLLQHDPRPASQKSVGRRPNAPKRTTITGATVLPIAPDNYPAAPADSGPLTPPGIPLVNHFDLNDINQGNLSDCYFLAALAALALQRPDFLATIVRLESPATPTTPAKAVVQFTRNNMLVRVHVDLLLPTTFNRPGPDADCWVEVMEKAFAFFRTGQNLYASINWGNPAETFSALGLTPIPLTPTPQNAATFATHLAQKHPICLLTPASPGYSLIPSHCYTLTAISPDLSTLTLRNPWGNAIPNPISTLPTTALTPQTFPYTCTALVPTVEIQPTITPTTISPTPTPAPSTTQPTPKAPTPTTPPTPPAPTPYSPTPDSPTHPLLDDSQFLSQTVPTTMTAGKTYPLSLTFKNTGTSTWTNTPPTNTPYTLGTQNPRDNTLFAHNRIPLPSPTPPGATATFTTTLTAPTTPGTYNLQWCLLTEHLRWFGHISPQTTITVTK